VREQVDPLYLFGCSLEWKNGAPDAGWRLLESLRFGAEAEKNIAASLLASSAGLSLRDRSHAPLLWRGSAMSRNSSFQELLNREMSMNTPYGLEIIENCSSCQLRQNTWFCTLSPEVERSFSGCSHQNTYPGGSLLFVEGQKPRGVFVLCTGRAKLFTTSRDGKVLILKIAQPGEVLGLSAVISGTSYELSAETSGPCQVNFIDRESMMNLVRRNGELGLHAAEVLSREFQSAYRDIHDLVLARSSTGKLAKLLLSWTDTPQKSNEIRIRSSLTHEEIAQMIGSSRETVTRLLSSLKKKQVIRVEGSTLVIRNRVALEALAA
jgi:CRP/FNR family transcriptional regulator, cyclic AMP receptor protein